MGFKTLSNGWEYYSISEELKIFSEELYGFLSNLAPSWFLLIFVIFMGLFAVYISMYVQMYIKNMAKTTGGF